MTVLESVNNAPIGTATLGVCEDTDLKRIAEVIGLSATADHNAVKGAATYCAWGAWSVLSLPESMVAVGCVAFLDIDSHVIDTVECYRP